jgi:hypothetical protein
MPEDAKRFYNRVEKPALPAAVGSVQTPPPPAPPAAEGSVQTPPPEGSVPTPPPAAPPAPHAKAVADYQAKVDALDAANKDFQARLARMALNALGSPTGGCAQSWPEALEECGGYDEAVRKYPHLAEQYRKDHSRG